MSQNLKDELAKLDERINATAALLKVLKRARRKVASALEQLSLPL